MRQALSPKAMRLALRHLGITVWRRVDRRGGNDPAGRQHRTRCRDRRWGRSWPTTCRRRAWWPAPRPPCVGAG